MTKSRINELRSKAQPYLGKQQSAGIIIELLDEVERLQRRETHLLLKSRPSQKQLGIGELYGVG